MSGLFKVIGYHSLYRSTGATVEGKILFWSTCLKAGSTSESISKNHDTTFSESKVSCFSLVSGSFQFQMFVFFFGVQDFYGWSVVRTAGSQRFSKMIKKPGTTLPSQALFMEVLMVCTTAQRGYTARGGGWLILWGIVLPERLRKSYDLTNIYFELKVETIN